MNEHPIETIHLKKNLSENDIKKVIYAIKKNKRITLIPLLLGLKRKGQTSPQISLCLKKIGEEISQRQVRDYLSRWGKFFDPDLGWATRLLQKIHKQTSHKSHKSPNAENWPVARQDFLKKIEALSIEHADFTEKRCNLLASLIHFADEKGCFAANIKEISDYTGCSSKLTKTTIKDALKIGLLSAKKFQRRNKKGHITEAGSIFTIMPNRNQVKRSRSEKKPYHVEQKDDKKEIIFAPSVQSVRLIEISSKLWQTISSIAKQNDCSIEDAMTICCEHYNKK